MRDHGFQRPFNSMQMGTWILLPLLIVQFLIFVSPVLPVAASVPCTILFVALGLASAYTGYRCTATNPIDDRLVRHLERQKAEGGGGDGDAEDGGGGNDGDGPTKYCWVCQTNVHDRSMHCKFCDKCVSNFDHHCMWLNTCVGSANYGYFYSTVVATFCFVFVHAACLAGVVVAYFVQAYGTGGGPQVDRMNGWFNANAALVVAIVDLFFLIVNVVSLSLVGQLLVFHIGLRKEGITTYEYIVRENQRKRDKSKEAMQVRSKRMVMLRAADAKGDKGEIIRLQVGRVCVPCDPAAKAVQEDRRKEQAEKERREARAANAADEEEGGFHHEESSDEEEGGGSEPVRGGLSSSIQPSVQREGGDEKDDSDPSPAEAAREQPRPPPLQEAMASRDYHDGERTTQGGGEGEPGPEFISVGVTECTHPSASSTAAPSERTVGAHDIHDALEHKEQS